jgi:hypothetical protein
MRSVQYRILSHRDRVIFRRKIDSRCFPQKIRQSSLLQHSTRCRYDRHHHQNHHVQTFFFFPIHPCNYYYLSLFNLVIHFFLFSYFVSLTLFLSLSLIYSFFCKFKIQNHHLQIHILQNLPIYHHRNHHHFYHEHQHLK